MQSKHFSNFDALLNTLEVSAFGELGDMCFHYSQYIVRIYCFRLYSDNWYISISLFNNVLRLSLNFFAVFSIEILFFLSGLSHIDTLVLLKYCHFSV